MATRSRDLIEGTELFNTSIFSFPPSNQQSSPSSPRHKRCPEEIIKSSSDSLAAKVWWHSHCVVGSSGHHNQAEKFPAEAQGHTHTKHTSMQPGLSWPSSGQLWNPAARHQSTRSTGWQDIARSRSIKTSRDVSLRVRVLSCHHRHFTAEHTVRYERVSMLESKSLHL